MSEIEKPKVDGTYEKIYEKVAEYAQNCYGDLIGSLLTTFEATVDDDRKLRALRTRIKSIQGLAWESMFAELWSEVEWSEQKNSGLQAFESLLNKDVSSRMVDYNSQISNLICAVFSDESRIHALNRELSRLVLHTRDRIQKEIYSQIECQGKK